MIKALSPVFGYEAQGSSFSVTAHAEPSLQIASRLAHEPGALIGLYVPESAYVERRKLGLTDEAQFGRMVALVRPLPMPPGHSTRTYASGWEEYKSRLDKLVDRWPDGWPCETVFYSTNGPILRDVLLVLRRTYKQFADFTGLFIDGLVDLKPAQYQPLRDQLMREIRHEITRNPSAQIRPF